MTYSCDYIIKKEKAVQRLVKIFFFLILILQASCSEGEKNEEKSPTKKNDHLFALSWSPAYCLLDEKGSTDQAQCLKPKKDYRFIVHGLWIQQDGDANSASDYLKYCEVPTQRVTAQIVTDMFDIMPSSDLMNHTWRKHGTCTGLAQKDYFKTAKSLYEKFNIDQVLTDVNESKVLLKKQIINNVLNAFPHFDEENIIINCRGRFLREIRICLNSEFDLRTCSLDERRAECRGKKIHIPFEPRA